MATFIGRERVGDAVARNAAWPTGTAQIWKHSIGERGIHAGMALLSLAALALCFRPVVDLVFSADEAEMAQLIMFTAGPVAALSLIQNGLISIEGETQQAYRYRSFNSSDDPEYGTRRRFVGGRQFFNKLTWPRSE